MSEKKINLKKNKLLYPLHVLMGSVVHLLLTSVNFIIPEHYREKISKLETNSTFCNIFGLTLFNSLGGLMVLATNIKIANLLGASMFGVYSYYLAIGEVGQNFVRYGRNKTMTRDLIQNPDKFKNLVSNTFVLSLINIVIYLVTLFAFQKPLDVDITIATILLVLAPCLHSIDFQPVYESMKQISWHSLYVLFQKIFYLAAIWIAILLMNQPSITYLGLVLFLSWLLIDILQFKEIIGQFSISLKKYVSFASLKRLYKENFVIALSCMTGVAFGPVIRLILKDYADTQAVGIYSAGMQIFMLSQFFMNQISRVGNPMMAEAGKADCSIKMRRRFCKRYLLMMILAVIPFAFPLCVIPQMIADTFFNQEFQELGSYLPYFGLYLIALSIGVVFTQFLISMRQDKIYFAIYVSIAIITILVAFPLVSKYSVLGAVISLCIPHSAGCILYCIFSIKHLR